MKVLFISMWYYPDPVAKPHILARELEKRGHSVTVITTIKQMRNIQKIENVDKIKIIRVKLKKDRSTSAIKRVSSMLWFTIKALIVALGLRKQDIIWTYQIGFPGFLYSVITRTPHIHEIQDLWPEWGEKSLTGLNKSLSLILSKSQETVYKQAKMLVTISKGFKTVIVDKYRLENTKVVIMPNWANKDHFDRMNHSGYQKSDFGLEELYTVTYGGNIGPAQGLKSLIQAGGNIEKGKVNIVIAGDGIEREKLEKYAETIKANNIKFIKKMHPFEMGALFSVSDLLFLGLNSDDKYRIAIPSKVYSYYSSGKPILAAVNGDTAELILQENTGLVVSPGNAQEIENAILLAIENQHELESIGENGYILSRNKYSGEQIVNRYEKLVLAVGKRY